MKFLLSVIFCVGSFSTHFTYAQNAKEPKQNSTPLHFDLLTQPTSSSPTKCKTPPPRVKSTIKPISLSGPRIGVTYLSKSVTDQIEKTFETTLEPVIIQFGWQFETQFFTTSKGVTGVSEWIPLIGGFEQDKFIPSLSWLIGMRSAEGFEFGAGPNVSLSGTSLILAAGLNFRSAEINFPINLGYSLSKTGGRYSLLFGFNIRDLN